MPDDSFKGSVKVQHPEDKKAKVELKYKAETDKDGQMTVTIKVEGEREVHTHTIQEAMAQEEKDDRAARRKLMQETQKAIEAHAEDIITGRTRSTDRVFKSMSQYIKG
jgi:hypothetical protein